MCNAPNERDWRDGEIQRLKLIIKDYVAICKDFCREVRELREKLAAVDKPVQQSNADSDSSVA